MSFLNSLKFLYVGRFKCFEMAAMTGGQDSGPFTFLAMLDFPIMEKITPTKTISLAIPAFLICTRSSSS